MKCKLCFLLVICLILSSITFSACKESSENIATVQEMYVTAVSFVYRYAIVVQLRPTDLAQPNTNYTVRLYEKDQFRSSITVSWNQPEINVLAAKDVLFPISKDEYYAYEFKDVSHIYTVKVNVPIENTPRRTLEPWPTLKSNPTSIESCYESDLTIEPPSWAKTFGKRLEAGQYLKISFTVVGGDNDIRFYIINPIDNKVLDTGKVVNTHQLVYEIPMTGMYSWTFDNSFAKTTTKRIKVSTCIGGALP
ncbi:MAG: emp24/gp25L/p24 family protein [Chloroflexi bacterium]|nr:emp24/gp25L/p24 family protein [Chloroflexota bacterium]MBM4433012.1 emp24/gp25L/p24 family protein [Chloroflexota bacterium]